ncbi:MULTISPECIES: hypothetical protein [Hwangdonia]|uniref:Lipoprotein n=1 Tax=Hwangdonia seohaensis TaxID=1240727 RepID=A0ABW3RCX7_9FLAO|nr:hypothetical protein [Hwangdonia seohaensis]
MKTLIKTIQIIVIGLLVSSCVSSKNYANRINTWRGADVNDLINSWGPPSDIYELPNGSKMYTYLYVNNSLVTTRHSQFADVTYQSTTQNYCQTSFTANKNNVIESTTFKGSSCISLK